MIDDNKDERNRSKLSVFDQCTANAQSWEAPSKSTCNKSRPQWWHELQFQSLPWGCLLLLSHRASPSRSPQTFWQSSLPHDVGPPNKPSWRDPAMATHSPSFPLLLAIDSQGLEFLREGGGCEQRRINWWIHNWSRHWNQSSRRRRGSGQRGRRWWGLVHWTRL